MVKAAAVLCVMFASAWFAGETLAQSPTGGTIQADDTPDWLRSLLLMGGLGAGPGITIWYLWYDQTKIKPRMERDFRNQMDMLITRFEAKMKETEERHAAHWTLATTNSRSDLHELAKGWREDNLRIVTAIEKMSENVSDNACKYRESAHAPRQ